MSERTKNDYLLAPLTVGISVSFWLGEQAVRIARSRLPFMSNPEVEFPNGEPEEYYSKPRSLGILARKMAMNLEDDHYLEHGTAEMLWRSIRHQQRFEPGESGATFDPVQRVADIMRSKDIPEEKINELLETETARQVISDPGSASPPSIRTL